MYHVPPDEFLATNQTAREVERLLTTIRERAELEYTLRQQRNELRSLANRLMHAQDDETTPHRDDAARDDRPGSSRPEMLLARLNRPPTISATANGRRSPRASRWPSSR